MKRWATIEHSAIDRHYIVTYHRMVSKKQLPDLFEPTAYGKQIFHTIDRAKASCEIWERRGLNLKTEKWNEKSQTWE